MAPSHVVRGVQRDAQVLAQRPTGRGPLPAQAPLSTALHGSHCAVRRHHHRKLVVTSKPRRRSPKAIAADTFSSVWNLTGWKDLSHRRASAPAGPARLACGGFRQGAGHRRPPARPHRGCRRNTPGPRERQRASSQGSGQGSHRASDRTEPVLPHPRHLFAFRRCKLYRRKCRVCCYVLLGLGDRNRAHGLYSNRAASHVTTKLKPLIE